MNNATAVKKTLVTGLSVLEKALSNPHKINLDDEETLKVYLSVLRDEPVDGEIIAEAIRMIAKTEKFFPAPAIVVEYARKAAEEVRYRRTREYLDRCVSCVDENGLPCIAPKERVRAGLLLPEGDRTGDGSPAKELPAGEPSERAKQMMKYLTSPDRGDNVKVNQGPRSLAANAGG